MLFLNFLPSIFDVFVNDSCDSHGQQCIIPTAHKHNSQTKADTNERQRPKNKSMTYESFYENLIRYFA